MRIYSSIHKTPSEGETIDKEALTVLFDHEKAGYPDQKYTDNVWDHSSFVAYSIDYLTHDERADHFSNSKDT